MRVTRLLRNRIPVSSVAVTLLFLIAVSDSSLGAGDKRHTTQQSKSSNGKITRYDPPTDPALYVGSDTCKTCHDEISSRFEQTPHFATTLDSKLEAHKGAQWHGC